MTEADEEARFFSDVDQEPFTPTLEEELVSKGWTRDEIATHRQEGAMYNRRRNTAVYPLEYEGAEPESETARSNKVARNEPCPCGSGKKYKKCHGATNEKR